MWQDFVEVKVDTYPLPSDQIVDYENFLKTPVYEKQKEDNLAIHRLDYVGRVYFYIGWNEARPMFSTAKVRQAMTMAINRDRIIKQNLNGMGVPIHGTFYVYSNSNDASIKPWPYDPEKARRLLEEEGWYDSDGDGILDKEIEGKRVPFQFTLVYWVKNPTAKAIVDYIATALKEIGVICNLRGVDIADLSMVFDDKSFDALMMGWGLATPPENPRQLWYSAGAKQKGSSNAIGFANAEVDKIIDALDYEYNQGERIKLYHRFDRIIHEEQPYTFLYTPKSALLYRDYVQNVFLPVDRKDLIPGATIAEPDSNVFWLKRR
jgi:peptide/nickel transport system substrate-binding protein